MMLPTTLAELVMLAAVIWILYRLLEPLRRRLERLILRAIDPSKADIVDAEIVPREGDRKKEPPKE